MGYGLTMICAQNGTPRRGLIVASVIRSTSNLPSVSFDQSSFFIALF